jgi:hypothetical protein
MTNANKRCCEAMKYKYLSCYGVQYNGPWHCIPAVMHIAVVLGVKEKYDK